MGTLLVVALLLPASVAAAAIPTTPGPVDPESPPEARQFDFWIGEWDVNLRTLQPDATWRDDVAARAHIHPILGGKGILELWDAPAIKGFSLRSFEPDRGEWVLWLNWPGPDSSGLGSLSGAFRHGRGDFYARSPRADGSVSVSRYSFNDITPTSLRWDDAYSKDGGRTWTHNWIMEWTRTAARPTLDPAGGPAHTGHDGGRCTLDAFGPLDGLVGRRAGRLHAAPVDGPTYAPASAPVDASAEAAGGAGPAVLRGYRILGGCAVMLLLDDGAGDERLFAHLTWNTSAGRMDLLLLDDHPRTGARRYLGAPGARDLRLHDAAGGPGRVTIGTGDGAVTLIVETAGRGGPQVEWDARFPVP